MVLANGNGRIEEDASEFVARATVNDKCARRFMGHFPSWLALTKFWAEERAKPRTPHPSTIFPPTGLRDQNCRPRLVKELCQSVSTIGRHIDADAKEIIQGVAQV